MSGILSTGNFRGGLGVCSPVSISSGKQTRARHTHVYDEVLDRERASQLGDLVPKLVYVLKEEELDYC